MRWFMAFAALTLVANAQAQTPPPPPDAVAPTSTSQVNNNTSRYLLLPDISFISMVKGLFTNTTSNPDRNKFIFDSGELAIQSFVYPGIRQDAFIVFANGEAGVEEGFVTVQDLHVRHLPLSAVVGRRKVPFGRLNQLHPHSWSYIEPPTVLKNLVADESLNGDGGYLSYLFPTKFFLQLDAGYWGQPTPVADIPADGEGPSSGAGFRDTFGTVRLWVSHRMPTADLELGASHAQGAGIGSAGSARPDIRLSGLDLTYRTTARDSQRTLVRTELLSHEQKQGATVRRRDGYYVSVDRRYGPFRSMGLRYDNSGSPWAAGRERSLSLLHTHQLTEQTYLRLQATHGDRPGQKGFNELRLQWVWGVGPHTHNLE